MKNKLVNRERFFHKEVGECLEFWLGEPDNPESDYVCKIHKLHVPAFLAALKNSIDYKKERFKTYPYK